MKPRAFTTALSIVSLLVWGCSGGGGSSSASSSSTSTAAATAVSAVYAVPASVALSVSDVQQVIAQSVAEARARNLPAVIAVTDRVGNVLAIYAMAGAPSTVTLANLDTLQNPAVPAAAAAIAKAITGAYLSSGGNAFSTRTASEIIQQNFPPGPAFAGLASGPLFGVQFSQLPCSDLARRYTATAGTSQFIGPKRSPLGLAGDPGGFPLYKNGVMVGGVGVMANPTYGVDANFSVRQADPQEAIALAGTVGFDAPSTITADNVSIAGTTLDYSDTKTSDLLTTPSAAPAYSSLSAGIGGLIAVAGYYGGAAIQAGATYGTEASGVRAATTAEYSDPDSWVLSDGAGNNRYPPIAGADAAEVGSPLTAAETRALLQQAFAVMSETRAGIRNPLNSLAEVTISVVDTRGTILGVVRAPDAPIFGTDVSVQKARTAAFFSDPNAASDLMGNSDPTSGKAADIASFVAATRTFLGNPTAFTGQTAWSVRAIGNISRPYFPDGQAGTPNGPLSRPITTFSPFNTGLQTALILTNLLGTQPDRGRCTYLPDVTPGQNRLQNGLQIFSGGVPIYRNGVLVGAIGVSGDGVDQDDMIAFLGLSNAATVTGTITEAPAAIRADQIVVNGTRLRYVNCPTTPYVNSSQQNVCSGI